MNVSHIFRPLQYNNVCLEQIIPQKAHLLDRSDSFATVLLILNIPCPIG